MVEFFGIDLSDLFEVTKGKVFSLIITALGVVTIYDPVQKYFDTLLHEVLKLTDFGRFVVGLFIIIIGVSWNLWKRKR